MLRWTLEVSDFCFLFVFHFQSQTAALARKNSEVTRALAAREDVLEKELGEIHTVLLAMQVLQICHIHHLCCATLIS